MSGSKGKLFLKPAKTGFQRLEANSNNTSENGNSFNAVNNPFLKCEEKEEDTPKNEKLEDPAKDISNELREHKTDELFKPAKKNLNLFTNATTLSENSNFVFGQNLHARVVIDKNSPSLEGTSKKSDDESNSSSGLLFSTALKEESANNENVDQAKDASTQLIEKKEDDKNTESSKASTNDNSLSLVEAARRYEEMKGAQKRKYEEVEIKTGEEDEKNILEMNCKLFTFDKNNWEERGRGTLRLNDCKNSSRVVFRASGSFRVLLNTKVFRDQLCEQPSSKSLRLTAIDSAGLIKIYLVMGKNEDIENLNHYLSNRIQREKNRTPEPEDEENSRPNETVDVNESSEPANKKTATSDE
ncbi:unnamed protein product [Chironomus riparius]|uniref:RanBD1 domain-containing protein n=1 Tax=Chironomus riparius TaxID=315576 RepID=A0A9N9WVL8_9DIPT|nr:unnamed protein product [Chironomus riparius]